MELYFNYDTAKIKIKDGVLLRIREEWIVDRSKLLKYNPNLRMLAEDIRHSKKDEHFENYLLKAEELFAEEVKHAEPRENPPLGKRIDCLIAK